MKRRTMMLAAAAVAASTASVLTARQALADGVFGVQVVEDLGALAALAEQRRAPIVLLVSATDCAYCKKLKGEVLVPLNRSGQYAGKILLREWLIDTRGNHRDFEGQSINPRKFARGYDASLTPTLLFLDSQGREIAQRMVGINTLEFYNWYLDQAISAARERLDENG